MNEPEKAILPPNIKELDRFIKISEAAELLGYANYQSIHHMHKRGLVELYTMPHNGLKRVLLSDLERILERSQLDTEDYFEKSLIENKRSRGRPRKFN
jgi:hypothetical protein